MCEGEARASLRGGAPLRYHTKGVDFPSWDVCCALSPLKIYAAVASIICVMNGRMKRAPVVRSAVCSWDRRSIQPHTTYMMVGVSSAVPVHNTYSFQPAHKIIGVKRCAGSVNSQQFCGSGLETERNETTLARLSYGQHGPQGS